MSSVKSGSKFARLSSKILLAMGSVLILFALVIGFYYVIMLSQGSGAVKTTAPTDLLAEQMKAALLEAQKNETIFRLNPDSAAVNGHKEAVARLLTLAGQFAQLSRENNNGKGVAAAGQISGSAQQLDSAFLELVQARETKGINNSTGLRGKIGSAGRELEQIISRNEAGALALSFLRIQSHGREYLRTNNSAELSNLRSAIKDFSRRLIDTRIEPVEAQMLRKSIRDFNAALDRYQAVSLATSDRSLSATLGKEQERQADDMRDAMDNLEAVINRVNVPDALPLVLLIRQHEAHYLLTGDGMDARQVIDGLDALIESFNNSSILQKHKDEILATAEAYREAFTALVSQDAAINEILARLNATSASLESLVGTIAAGVPAPGKSLSFAGSGSNFAMTGMIAGLAVILIGLLIAVLLGKSIASPIISMTNIIRRITASKDFSVEIPVSSHYEIGKLAQELNTLLRLQQKTQSHATEITSVLSDKFDALTGIIRDLQLEVKEIGESGSRIGSSATEQEELFDKVNTTLIRLRGAAATMNQALQQSDEQSQMITDAVEHIGRSVESTVEGIKAITRSSSQISDIITLSTEIAEQTNLLALNASVKAARAGSHGKEFAVIADEIANLAQRSEEVAKEAGQLTVDLGARVDEAVQLGGESKKSLDQVHEAGRLNLTTTQELTNQLEIIDSSTGELDEFAGDIAAAGSEIQTMAKEQVRGCTAARESIELLLQTSLSIAGEAPEEDDDRTDTALKQAVDNIAISLNEESEGNEIESASPYDTGMENDNAREDETAGDEATEPPSEDREDSGKDR